MDAGGTAAGKEAQSAGSSNAVSLDVSARRSAGFHFPLFPCFHFPLQAKASCDNCAEGRQGPGEWELSPIHCQQVVTQGELKVNIRPASVEDPGGHYRTMCEALQTEMHKAVGAPKPALAWGPREELCRGGDI